jgi:hypothetical protein
MIIDVVMSLWMYFVRSREGNNPDKQTPPESGRGDRLRSQMERESGLRIYGSCHLKAHIERDILWRMPEAIAGVCMAVSVSGHIAQHGISPHRVVGFEDGWHRRDSPLPKYCLACARQGPRRHPEHPRLQDPRALVEYSGVDDDFDVELVEERLTVDNDSGIGLDHVHTLALQVDDPLERMDSRDLMFSFVTAVAKSQEILLETNVVQDSINYQDRRKGWKDVRLYNDKFTNLVRELERVGYGSLSEVYLDLIIPLSINKKMSNIHSIIRVAQKRAKECELSLEWDSLVNVAM